MKKMDSPTRALADFAARLRYEAIPKAVADHMKLCVMDTLGCGLFGSTLPWGRIVAEFARDLGGREEATLLGLPYKASPPNAALANGTMIHGFELDDLHRLSIIHAGSVTLPAALALAEKGSNGKDFLTAMVAGYEVGTRIGMAAGASHLHKGYHPTGTHGAFAAGAAAARILGLDTDRMVHTLGIAGTQGAGLMAAQYAAMVKRMHAGRASQSGVYAALLAHRGFTGITDILEADYGGYLKVMSDSANIELMTEKLGQRFEVLNVGFKIFSCCGSNFTSVEALSAIMRDNHLAASDIKKIWVRSSTVTKLHVGWDYVPEGATTAQMNLPYTLAVTAMDGETFVDQYTDERIVDPKILEFIKCIEITADPEIDKQGGEYRHATITHVETVTGKVFEKRIDFAKGGPANPVSRQEVEDKWWKLVGKVLPRDRAKELYETIWHLDELQSIGTLTRLLVPEKED
jgi:aconitate decarboxylase